MAIGDIRTTFLGNLPFANETVTNQAAGSAFLVQLILLGGVAIVWIRTH